MYPVATIPPPLYRNRDFQLLWVGQVISSLGTFMSGVAAPLLVLALTGSPGKAGVARFASTLPLLLFPVAGSVLDRFDRKRLMLGAEAVRGLAAASLALALWAGHASFAQVVVVGFVGGTGYVLVETGRRSAVPHLVSPSQLRAAAAQNQARDAVGLVAGLSLGGLLYALSHVLPFLANAFTYALSFFSILAIRPRLQEARTSRAEGAPLTGMGEAVRWLWRRPFLRITTLLTAGNDVFVNSLYLALIVIAQRRGAPPPLIGAMLAFIGAGGILGVPLAALLRRVPVPVVVIATMAVPALLAPLLLLVANPVLLGVIYGGMFVLPPSWAATVGVYPLALAPDRLLGKVQSLILLVALGSVPLGALATGFLLQGFGPGATVLILWGLAAVFAVLAVVSPSVRRPPPLPV